MSLSGGPLGNPGRGGGGGEVAGAVVRPGPSGVPPTGMRDLEVVDADPNGPPSLVRPEGSIVVLRSGATAWIRAAGAWRSCSLLGALYAATHDLSDLVHVAGESADIDRTVTDVLTGWPSTGTIVFPATTAGLANNDGYDFPTGVGTATKRIEYQVDDDYVATPGAVTVDARGQTTWDRLRVVLRAAIAANSNVVMQAEEFVTFYTLSLQWPTVGVAGNVPLTQTFALAGWSVTGFVDGREPLAPLGAIAARLVAAFASAAAITVGGGLADVVGQIVGRSNGGGLVIRTPNHNAGNPPGNMIIAAGDADTGNDNGGDVVLNPGAACGSGVAGKIDMAGSTFSAADWAALLALAGDETALAALAAQEVPLLALAGAEADLAALAAEKAAIDALMASAPALLALANEPWSTGQVQRDWYGLAALGADVYATVYGGSVYKQTAGAGQFAVFDPSNRNWTDICALGADLFAAVISEDIYKSTGGGAFVGLGQTYRSWRGLCALGADLYASESGGDIYKRTGGAGNFAPLGQAARLWRRMCAIGADLYCNVWGGDIYKRTGGAGDFQPLGQVPRNWLGMVAVGADIYCAVQGGVIYKRTGGAGDFVAVTTIPRMYQAMCVLAGVRYAAEYGGDIYRTP